MRKDIDDVLFRLAATQDNVFSVEQTQAAGASPSLRLRRVHAGRWIRVGAGGFVPAGARLTWRGRLRCAVWDARHGALVSHHAAAQLHGYPGFDKNEVHVLVPRALDHECTIATVHSSRRFELVKRTMIWGIPVVDRADTVIHVARHLRLQRLSWLTDELLLSKRVNLGDLRDAYDRLGTDVSRLQGLRAVLADHAPGEPVPESRLEQLFLEVVTARGLPAFRRQVHIPGRDQRPARVDFLWPDVKVIVEVDGRRWHARFQDFDRDARRDLHTLGLGYRTAHVTWAMLTHDPDEVCVDLVAARAAVA